MPARDRHEAVWEALPEGLEPSDLALRQAFLLDSVQPGSRVLDVGCGEGFFAASLSDAGAEVLAMDVAEEPLRRARARVPGLETRLVPDGGQWPLADAEFDLVWAGEVLEHVHDTAGWLSEVRRVLRPHGVLLLSTPGHPFVVRLRLALSGRAFAAHFHPLGDHVRFYTRRSLAALLGDFGFEQISVRAAGRPRLAPPLLLARAVRSRF